jgi:hydrogenase-4 component E
MSETVNLLVGIAMGLNLIALGSSRLPSVIRAMGVQGIVLGLLPLVLEKDFHWAVAAVAVVTILVKGFVIPSLLRRAMRSANVDREIAPFIGFVASLLLGGAGTIAAVAAARMLTMLTDHIDTKQVTYALEYIFTE